MNAATPIQRLASRNTEDAMHVEREIDEVLARYVRAADRRDGVAMERLFADDATLEIASTSTGSRELLGSLRGAKAIGDAVTGLMAPHPARGFSHHTTLNHLVEVRGDAASLEAQFIVYNVVGKEKPVTGWPAGAAGAQGDITPIESGYWQAELRRIDGTWKIAHCTIQHDLPYAF